MLHLKGALCAGGALLEAGGGSCTEGGCFVPIGDKPPGPGKQKGPGHRMTRLIPLKPLCQTWPSFLDSLNAFISHPLGPFLGLALHWALGEEVTKTVPDTKWPAVLWESRGTKRTDNTQREG